MRKKIVYHGFLFDLMFIHQNVVKYIYLLHALHGLQGHSKK